MAKILITNNGPHSPEKWAMTTAETIFDVSTVASEDRQIQAKKLQILIAEALMPHHHVIQDTEKTNLASDVSTIHGDLFVNVDHVMSDILAVAKGTPWEEHFKTPMVQEAMKEVMVDHFMTSRHIERLWHADRNPHCAVSQQYKTKFHS